MYPYSSAVILTDETFINYGGLTGSSTAFQRDAAYQIAEEWASTYLNTLLVPTTVTGSFYYPHVGGVVKLDWAYLQEVKEIRFRDTKDTNYYTITGTVGNYGAAIRDQERSILDIFYIHGNCSGCGDYAPYRYEIVYSAGLPTGTSTSPKFLAGLTTLAQIAVNEFQGFGNEGSGDVAITEFRNQQYSEKRGRLLYTVFGGSTKANWALKLLSSIKRRVGIGF